MRRHLAGPLIALCLALPRVAFANVHMDLKLPDGYVDETVAFGFGQPNSMAFLPDWRVLVTEQHTGRLRVVVGGAIAHTDPAYQVPDLNGDGFEQGFQGVAVDPGWPQRPYIYVYYDRTGNHCCVVRLRAYGDINVPDGQNLYFRDPLVLIGDIPDQHITHNSGCVRFGPDGYLYVSTGDDDVPCAAADSTTLLGAILRLKVDELGDEITTVTRSMITPPDNPLSSPDSNARLVWAFGMRNPWRFTIDSYTGRIYSADVGLLTYEELNEILPGDFLGWPWREGPQITPRDECPEPGGTGSGTYKAAQVSMLRDPDISVAISSAGVYRPLQGAPYNWPEEMNGSLFYGEYYSGDLWRLKQQDGVWVPADSLPGQPSGGRFASGLFTAVDFMVGPDGSYYYLSQFDTTATGYTGSIHRIRYPSSPNDLAVGDPARAGVELSAGPNPFRGRTQIVFRLPQASRVTVDLFDLLGRRVRRLVDGVRPAGEGHVAWDGDDARGRALPAGVYLVRLELPHASVTRRLVRTP